MIMIPIFILTCDRLTVLKKSIQSYYDYIKTPFEIVIIDFGSTYEPTRDFLKHVESEGIKVYWKERIFSKPDFDRPIQEAIRDYFENHPRSNYVVTDPDIALDNVKGDVLEVYAFLLEKFYKMPTVGPIMRTDDLPDCFPGKEGIINWEKRLNSRRINSIQYKGKTIKYINSYLDSTFRMNRAGTYWKRAKRAFRVLPPYGSKHLDWYLDPKNLTQDHKYYMEHASADVSHSWGVHKHSRQLKEA